MVAASGRAMDAICGIEPDLFWASPPTGAPHLVVPTTAQRAARARFLTEMARIDVAASEQQGQLLTVLHCS